MDPQLRLLLETVYEATEDGVSMCHKNLAGYLPEKCLLTYLLPKCSRDSYRIPRRNKYFCLLGLLWKGLSRSADARS